MRKRKSKINVCKKNHREWDGLRTSSTGPVYQWTWQSGSQKTVIDDIMFCSPPTVLEDGIRRRRMLPWTQSRVSSIPAGCVMRTGTWQKNNHINVKIIASQRIRTPRIFRNNLINTVRLTMILAVLRHCGLNHLW